MRLVLDGEKICSREDLHRQVQTTLDLPEWYGGNLDALYDCLSDLMPEVDIQILNLDILREKLGDYADKLLRVLQDAQKVNLNIQIVIL